MKVKDQILGAAIIIIVVLSVSSVVKINNLQSRLDTQMVSINNYQNELGEIKSNINTAKNEIRGIQKSISVLSKTKVSYSDMQGFSDMVEHLNDIIGTYEEVIN